MAHTVQWTETGEPYIELAPRGVHGEGYRWTPLRPGDSGEFVCRPLERFGRWLTRSRLSCEMTQNA